MRVVEQLLFGALLLLVLMCLLFARRTAISRAGGSIVMNVRLSRFVKGRGWSPGIARFVGDELRWYRVFSLAWRPRCTLTRRSVEVQARRLPEGPERLVLPEDWIIVRCLLSNEPIEIAMAQSTLTGFLSWIEAAPPGAASTRLAAG
jgi:hypothetical protein